MRERNIDEKALTVAWEVFKLIDPKINSLEMKEALAKSILAYENYVKQETLKRIFKR